MVIISLLLYVFSLSDQTFVQYLSLAIIIAGIIIGILNYKNKVEGGFITYGQSLGSGVLTGLFAAIVLSVYTIIFFKFIDPDMVNVILKKAEENMRDRNQNMTEDQIDMAMSYTRKFMNPYIMAITSTIWLTFMSFIASLIISIFTKKADKSFESNFR
jgi:drug/metabolite transporter (DMT)-like permease